MPRCRPERQSAEALALAEEHVRFMILAEHELCECLVVDADQEAFNSHLNKEQIIKARAPPAARAAAARPKRPIVQLIAEYGYALSSPTTKY